MPYGSRLIKHTHRGAARMLFPNNRNNSKGYINTPLLVSQPPPRNHLTTLLIVHLSHSTCPTSPSLKPLYVSTIPPSFLIKPPRLSLPATCYAYQLTLPARPLECSPKLPSSHSSEPLPSVRPSPPILHHLDSSTTRLTRLGASHQHPNLRSHQSFPITTTQRTRRDSC